MDGFLKVFYCFSLSVSEREADLHARQWIGISSRSSSEINFPRNHVIHLIV